MVGDCENRKRWKKMTLRMTQEEYNEITAAAAQYGGTLTAFVLHLVRKERIDELEKRHLE